MLFFLILLTVEESSFAFAIGGGPSGKVVVAFPQHLSQARELSIFISKCKGLST